MPETQEGRDVRSAGALPATAPQYWAEMVGSRPPKVWLPFVAVMVSGAWFTVVAAVDIDDGVVGVDRSAEEPGATAEAPVTRWWCPRYRWAMW